MVTCSSIKHLSRSDFRRLCCKWECLKGTGANSVCFKPLPKVEITPSVQLWLMMASNESSGSYHHTKILQDVFDNINVPSPVIKLLKQFIPGFQLALRQILLDFYFALHSTLYCSRVPTLSFKIEQPTFISHRIPYCLYECYHLWGITI